MLQSMGLQRVGHDWATNWTESPSAVILEPQKIKSLSLFPLFPLLFALKWWNWMPWSSFSIAVCSIVHSIIAPILASGAPKMKAFSAAGTLCLQDFAGTVPFAWMSSFHPWALSPTYSRFKTHLSWPALLLRISLDWRLFPLGAPGGPHALEYRPSFCWLLSAISHHSRVLLLLAVTPECLSPTSVPLRPVTAWYRPLTPLGGDQPQLFRNRELSLKEGSILSSGTPDLCGPGASDLVSLSLSALICAMGMLMIPTCCRGHVSWPAEAVWRRLLLRAKCELLLWMLFLLLWLSILPRPTANIEVGFPGWTGHLVLKSRQFALTNLPPTSEAGSAARF